MADMETARINQLIFNVRGHGEIRLYRSVIHALGNPACVRFWWNENDKSIFVSAAKTAADSAANTAEDAAIVIPNGCRHHKNGVRFQNRQLLNCLNILAGWEKGSFHRLYGEFIPELLMVVFKLDGMETTAREEARDA